MSKSAETPVARGVARTMPDGAVVWSPVLTPEEAVVYLGMQKSTSKKARLTLEYYRKQGVLKGVQIGYRMMYRIEDLDRFIVKQSEKIQ